MRVFFTNLGCKLNQAELEHLARRFSAGGHSVAPSLETADLHVVNTCSVTHVAARDSRKVARRGRRHNSGIRTVLTGCYVDSDPEIAAALTGVDLVVPNRDKERLLEEVEAAFPEALEEPAPAGHFPHPALGFGNARALVKIEDGCNMRCAFCIIPHTRGKQRSRPFEEVVDEVRRMADGGLEEIVITGVQISSYRWRGSGLYELTRALIERTAIRRLRLTSIAPWQFDRRLLDLFDTGRLCRHFHLSLQSGCDSTLERMRRPYSSAHYRELVGEIRARVPGAAITTDVIVGFPGETDEEFTTSLQFVEAIAPSRVHVFPYSPRPHTEALTMSGAVPHAVIRQRMRRMLTIAERCEGSFLDSQSGHRAAVLWEHRQDDTWLGTTDNYLKVALGVAPEVTPGVAPLAGRISEVFLTETARLGRTTGLRAVPASNGEARPPSVAPIRSPRSTASQAPLERAV